MVQKQEGAPDTDAPPDAPPAPATRKELYDVCPTCDEGRLVFANTAIQDGRPGTRWRCPNCSAVIWRPWAAVVPNPSQV